jgi:type IV pilus assembly protein PilB
VRPRILVADDDEAVRDVMVRLLSERYEVLAFPSGVEAMEYMEGSEPVPDLVILDVRMPGMDGYQVCARMQESDELAWIPVIFVTILESEENRRRAFAVGATAYVEKPFDQEELLQVVTEHVGTGQRWTSLKDKGSSRKRNWLLPSTFVAFKRYILEQRDANPAQRAAVEKVGPEEIYRMAPDLRLSEEQLARYLARFLELPYRERINSEELSLSKLPRTFCATNHVLVLKDDVVVMANPFDWELIDVLERALWRKTEPEIAITAPGRIRQLCDAEKVEVDEEERESSGRGDIERTINIEDRGRVAEVEGFEIQALANEILRSAIADRASDVHIEPKERAVLVRYRIDGDMHDVRTLSGPQGARLISRLKALAGMDIAERRRPQDGSLGINLLDRSFKLRLATSSTRHGETVVVRILEPTQDPMSIEELGFSSDHAKSLRTFMTRSQGLVLVVGPTGSGKSTTIFSLLSVVDGRSRSIMSVEDPVEYRIPHANQQQVNPRAGIDFDTLLRSAMRQDPDILFLGEVRDPFSARTAMEFASSGHLTISTLHSSNSTTAVFRLERLGVERGAMADAISGIVAQKLLKTLCPECRDVGAITEEEAAMLAGFISEVPDRVARPVGCPACRETGYRGREVVGEVLPFDRDIARQVRDGASIADIRLFSAERGDPLIGNHAVEKVRALKFPVQDVYEQVLVEEWAFGSGAREETEGDGKPEERATAKETAATPKRKSATPVDSELPEGLQAPAESPLILVVDDDPDVRTLLDFHLTNAGYAVVTAADGVEALIEIGRREFDAVLSDIRMPNLDGEKLMEMIGQKAVDVPAIFLTGVDDEKLEGRLLAFGALDYIRKPVRKEVLLMRLRNAVMKGRKGAERAE